MDKPQLVVVVRKNEKRMKARGIQNWHTRVYVRGRQSERHEVTKCWGGKEVRCGAVSSLLC